MSRPARIASLLASATEILYGIGAGDRVVAVSHECDFPAEAAGRPRATFSRINSDRDSLQIDGEVKQRLAAGDPLYEVDWDLLQALNVDLIVTQAQCDVCSVRYRDVVDRVSADATFRQTAVVALNPQSIDEVLADVARIGQRVGASPAADRFVGRLRGRIDAVSSAASQLVGRELPRVACVEWTEPLMLAGNWIPEMIGMAGGRCQVPAAGAASTCAGWDSVRAYDPQVIVVAPCGFDLDRSLDEIRRLDAPATWHGTAAARSGRVYAVDGNAYFNRSGPRLVDTLEILAHLLHPTRFEIPLPAEKWYQTVAQIEV